MNQFAVYHPFYTHTFAHYQLIPHVYIYIIHILFASLSILSYMIYLHDVTYYQRDRTWCQSSLLLV